MTGLSVRGVAARGPVVVTVEGDQVTVTDESTGEVVWQRSGPGVDLRVIGEEIDVDGAMTVNVGPGLVSQALRLVELHRSSSPASATETPIGAPARSTRPAEAPLPVHGAATPPSYLNELCDRLDRAANAVQFLALLLGLGGSIGGLVLAFHTDQIGDRPFVAEGIALLFAALVQAAVLYLFGVWGVAWAARNRMAR